MSDNDLTIVTLNGRSEEELAAAALAGRPSFFNKMKDAITFPVDLFRFGGRGKLDHRPLLELNYPDWEWMKTCPIDLLEEAVKNDLIASATKTDRLTDNCKVIAAIRFLYEKPAAIAVFGDDATYVTAALKHIGKMGGPSYKHLLKEAGIALEHNGIYTLHKDMQGLDRVERSTSIELLKSLVNRELGPHMGGISNIASGTITAAKLNGPDMAFHTEENLTHMQVARKFYQGVVRRGAKKLGEVHKGLEMETVIPRDVLVEMKPLDVSQELEQMLHSGARAGAQGMIVGGKTAIHKSAGWVVEHAAPEFVGPRTRTLLGSWLESGAMKALRAFINKGHPGLPPSI